MDDRQTRGETTPAQPSAQLVREVLGCFAIDADRVRIERPPLGFSGAVIFRITAGKRDAGALLLGESAAGYCLRGWPRPGLPPRRILELHRFLRFLHESGLHVLAVPIPGVKGETLVQAGGRWWQLEPWMPGTADFHQSPADARLFAVMRALAGLHRSAACYKPTPSGREWFAGQVLAASPAVRERIALWDGWTEKRIRHSARRMKADADHRFGEIAQDILDHLRSVGARVRADLAQLSQRPVSLHPCLRDIWHDHVLLSEDDVTGMIDPSAARTENVAADLSRLLGSMLGPHDVRWTRALDAYAAVRPLTDLERTLVPALHESGILLSGLVWIDRRLRSRIPSEAPPAILARMEHIRDWLRA